MNKPKIVILSGAGISAESGIPTFRDSNGLWENYKIEDVATPEGWRKNKGLVLDFYNQRRRDAKNCQPNAGHIGLVELEEKYDVTIVTQNVDNLHEKAGSTNVIHLHGNLFQSRSTLNPKVIYDCEGDINIGDKCELGSQLRPHIVWFKEDVPEIHNSIKYFEECDIAIIIGTSLQVYPAAGLLDYIHYLKPVYLLDPSDNTLTDFSHFKHIKENVSSGIKILLEELLSDDFVIYKPLL